MYSTEMQEVCAYHAGGICDVKHLTLENLSEDCDGLILHYMTCLVL